MQVTLRMVSKRFRENGVLALCDVDWALAPGGIHTIAGENGAGKSTLAQILGGFIRPDAGFIAIDGAVQQFSSPAAALAAGIGVIRQRPRAVGSFTVWENCALGAEGAPPPPPPRGGGGGIFRNIFFGKRAARERVEAVMHRYGFSLPLDEKMENQSPAVWKKTAVISLLLRGVEVFVFDEPFAHLSKQEQEVMMSLLLSLEAEGKTAAVITHGVEEMLPVSRRITVLRKGRVTLERERDGGTDATTPAFDLAEIYTAMFGPPETGMGGGDRPQVLQTASTPPPPPPPPPQKILEVQGLSVAASPETALAPIEDITFTVAAGEIVGIDGMKEDGAETLEFALAGFIQPSTGSVTIRRGVNGKTGEGLAYFGQGAAGIASPAAPSLSIKDNLIIHAYPHWTNKNGFLNQTGLLRFAGSLVDQAQVSASVRRGTFSLSGGMLSRTLIEREFAKNAPLLLLSNADAGLDARASQSFYRRVRSFVNSGGAAVLFTAGDAALKGLCTRRYTLKGGRFL